MLCIFTLPINTVPINTNQLYPSDEISEIQANANSISISHKHQPTVKVRTTWLSLSNVSFVGDFKTKHHVSHTYTNTVMFAKNTALALSIPRCRFASPAISTKCKIINANCKISAASAK